MSTSSDRTMKKTGIITVTVYLFRFPTFNTSSYFWPSAQPGSSKIWIPSSGKESLRRRLFPFQDLERLKSRFLSVCAQGAAVVPNSIEAIWSGPVQSQCVLTWMTLAVQRKQNAFASWVLTWRAGKKFWRRIELYSIDKQWTLCLTVDRARTSVYLTESPQ